MHRKYASEAIVKVRRNTFDPYERFARIVAMLAAMLLFAIVAIRLGQMIESHIRSEIIRNEPFVQATCNGHSPAWYREPVTMRHATDCAQRLP